MSSMPRLLTSEVHKLNTYTKTQVEYTKHIFDISSMLTVNNNGINIADISDTRYTQSEVDNNTAKCRNIGVPYNRAYALSSYALTCVASK